MHTLILIDRATFFVGLWGNEIIEKWKIERYRWNPLAFKISNPLNSTNSLLIHMALKCDGHFFRKPWACDIDGEESQMDYIWPQVGPQGRPHDSSPSACPHAGEGRPAEWGCIYNILNRNVKAYEMGSNSKARVGCWGFGQQCLWNIVCEKSAFSQT